MDTQAEKTRHAAAGPDEWDGPSKKNPHIHFFFFALQCAGLTEVLMNVGRSKVRIAGKRRHSKATCQSLAGHNCLRHPHCQSDGTTQTKLSSLRGIFPFNLSLSLKGAASKRWTARRTRRLRGNYCSATARSHTAEHTKYRSF